MDDWELLSSAVARLAEVGPDEDVFEWVAAELFAIEPDALVVTSSCDPGSGASTARAIAGPPGLVAEARAFLGREVRGLTFAIDEEVRRRMAGGELFIDGDRTRLTQVVANLLQNAAKFTPAGGAASLSVSADPESKEAMLKVCDSGAGIAAELLPYVFEPFVQSERTRKRSEGGVGLGLALVKGLVEMHSGSVVATSEGPGRGAQFTVRLPRAAPTREWTLNSSPGLRRSAARWAGRAPS